MGLSNKERLVGMYSSIKNLMDIYHRYTGDRQIKAYIQQQYVGVFDLVNQLWHAFLGRHSNSLHWFMGSSSINTVTDEPYTPWETAVCGHLEKAIRGIDGIDDIDDIDDIIEGPKVFDALRFVSLTYLVTRGEQGNALGYVVEVYQEAEQLLYYLRRYPDDFLEENTEVSKILSQIMGECFRAFTDCSDVAKAYVIREIMRMLYGVYYPYNKSKWDVVTQFMQAEHIHHDLSRLMCEDLKVLAKDHVALVKARVKAARKAEDQKQRLTLAYSDPEFFAARLFLMLKIASSVHEHEHIQQTLFKMLEGHKLLPQVKRETKRLASEFKKKKEETERQADHDYDMQQLDVYGAAGYWQLRDFLPQECCHKTQKKSKSAKSKGKSVKKKGKRRV